MAWSYFWVIIFISWAHGYQEEYQESGSSDSWVNVDTNGNEHVEWQYRPIPASSGDSGNPEEAPLLGSNTRSTISPPVSSNETPQTVETLEVNDLDSSSLFFSIAVDLEKTYLEAKDRLDLYSREHSGGILAYLSRDLYHPFFELARRCLDQMGPMALSHGGDDTVARNIYIDRLVKDASFTLHIAVGRMASLLRRAMHRASSAETDLDASICAVQVLLLHASELIMNFGRNIAELSELYSIFRPSRRSDHRGLNCVREAVPNGMHTILGILASIKMLVLDFFKIMDRLYMELAKQTTEEQNLKINRIAVMFVDILYDLAVCSELRWIIDPIDHQPALFSCIMGQMLHVTMNAVHHLTPLAGAETGSLRDDATTRQVRDAMHSISGHTVLLIRVLLESCGDRGTDSPTTLSPARRASAAHSPHPATTVVPPNTPVPAPTSIEESFPSALLNGLHRLFQD